MTSDRSAPFAAFTSSNGLVFTSGQVALDPKAPLTPDGIRPVAGGFEAQAHACLDNLEAVLATAGSGLKHVLRLECFLARESDLAVWHSVFTDRFQPPRPARTTVIARPPADGFLVEVQAIAAAVAVGLQA